MKQIVLLISLLFLASCCHVQQSTSPPENLVYPAVSLITAHDYNCYGIPTRDATRLCLLSMNDPGMPVAATIFWISDSVFVTAAHAAVFAEHDSGAHLVMSYQNKHHKKIKIENLVFMDAYDIAIGTVLWAPKHDQLRLCSEIYEGEHVTFIGLPPDMGPTQLPGQILGTTDESVYYIGDVRFGFSGGPALSNARNCVTGMVLEWYPKHHQTRAVSAETLQSILDAATSIPKASR